MGDPGLPALAGTICGPRTTEQGGWLALMRGDCRDDKGTDTIRTIPEGSVPRPRPILGFSWFS
jgi:hypothetical protein